MFFILIMVCWFSFIKLYLENNEQKKYIRLRLNLKAFNSYFKITLYETLLNIYRITTILHVLKYFAT